MTVRGRDFTRQDKLKPGVERIGRAGPSRQRRILEDQHAAFGFFRRYQIARFEEQGAHVGIAPDVGNGLGLWHPQEKVPKVLPQGREVMRRQPGVVLGPLRMAARALIVHRRAP